MRQKPDFLLLLSMLVVSGVLISHFVVIEQAGSTAANTPLPGTHYSSYNNSYYDNTYYNNNARDKAVQAEHFKSQELARIDLLKQRIR